jgi:predicted DNA-binding antitoxin AbrB/MazE fold protein
MSQTVTAIYENGVLILEEPLYVSEGARVEVAVRVLENKPQEKTPAEILADLAALPLEGEADKFSGRDHDKVLYGKGEGK